MIKFFVSFCFLISLFCLFYFYFFLRFVLSESDELELEEVSDSELSLDGELDVKELNDDDEL